MFFSSNLPYFSRMLVEMEGLLLPYKRSSSVQCSIFSGILSRGRCVLNVKLQHVRMVVYLMRRPVDVLVLKASVDWIAVVSIHIGSSS